MRSPDCAAYYSTPKSAIVRRYRNLQITYNPKLLDQICDLLLQCCSVRTCYESVSLIQSSFFEYIRRSDPYARDHDPRFLDFAERVTRARGEGKAELISR